MPSLMNGLSAMGSGIASFADQAGLEQQRAQLQQQSIALAAQLGHQGRMEEQAQQQQAERGIVGMQLAGQKEVAGIEAGSRLKAAQIGAGATLGAAGIAAQTSRENVAATIAANAPVVQAQVKQLLAAGDVAHDQAVIADKSLALSLAIAEESAKPPAEQDPAKIAQLYNQRLQLGMNAQTQAQLMNSLDTTIRATQQQATAADAAVARVIGQEASLNMGDPTVRARQKEEEAQVTAQRDAVYQQLHTLTSVQMSYLPHAPSQQQPEAKQPAPANRPPLSSILRAPGTPESSNTSSTGPAPGPRPGLMNAPPGPG